MTTAVAPLSAGQLAYLAQQEGFSGDAVPTIVAIDEAESSGRPDAIGDVGLEDSTWGPSVGLGQIRSLWSQKGTGGARDEQANLDPATNLAHQYAISNGGTDFSPWSTWWGDAQHRTGPGQGAFLKFLPDAEAAAEHPDPVAGGTSSSSSSNSAQGSTAFWGQGVLGDAVGGIVSGLLPVLVNAVFYAAGAGLIVLGVYKTANPGATVKGTIGQAASVAKLAAVA